MLDTNIWLERLLGQEQSDVVGELLSKLSTDQMIMSDFTLHSIGVIRGRFKETAIFEAFVRDVLIDGGVQLGSLPPELMNRVTLVMSQYRLDFDDAYQYVVAEQEQVAIISFDKDFDKAKQGRLTPAQVLASLSNSETPQVT
ncbi:MAG: PIN domain-containing protein [Caldilineaceae bacterium]|nr:PIN domain-containing protein [Caldilineaceae bacterium]